MNCPKCGTEAQAGAGYCKRCGAALAAKAKAAAKTAEPSSSDEIDLMPLDDKKPAYSAYEAPPGLEGGVAPPGGAAPSGPPGLGGPPPDAPVKKIRGAMAAPKTLPVSKIVGAAIGAILLLWIGWLVFRTKNEVKVGEAQFQGMIALQPNAPPTVKNIEVTGIVHYTLDVEVLEGEVLAGVVKRPHKDPKTLAAIKQGEPLQTVKKGEKVPFTGDFGHKEQWSWIVANDTKKVARVRVKFVAKP